jgi:threonine synthase
METYHGPTASFKDLSLQLLPKLMHTASQIRPSKTDSTTALLVATSGDTGTAALDGFTRIPNTPVIVLYPENGVSEIQRAQMQTCESNNACVIGIEGDFDFCQSTVKDIFNDKALNDGFAKILPGLHLSSANSINWGRLLPQIVFAVNSYTKLVEQGVIKVGEEFDLCIPTGNFGNMLGAVFAKRLGLPIRQLITASNENNIISDFLRTGEYDIRTRKFRATISPSIDILISSNLERFLYLLSDGDSKLISKLFTQLSNEGHFKVDGALLKKINETVIGDWCNEEECMRTIRETYETTKRLIDPHTAVAVAVSKRYKQDSTPIVVASTAHSGKFPSTMLKALQVDTLPEDAKDKHHPEIENLKNKPTKQPTVLPANKEQVISTIRKFLKQYK